MEPWHGMAWTSHRWHVNVNPCRHLSIALAHHIFMEISIKRVSALIPLRSQAGSEGYKSSSRNGCMR